MRQESSERPIVRHSLLLLWQARGWWGGLLAVGLAWWGQHLLIAEQRPLAARNLYAAAIVLLIGALWSPRRLSSSSTEALPGSPSVTGFTSGWHAWRARYGWRITVCGCALTAVFSVAMSVALWGNQRSAVAPWLWVSALVTLLVTFVGVPAWPAAGALIPGPAEDPFAEGEPQLPVPWEAVAISAVLLVALYLRLTNLEYVPGIFGDEGERGVSARMLLEGFPASLFGSGWYGVPTFYFYCVAWMLRIFGDTMVGARMLSVLSGVAAVWLAYRIGRALWGARTGLLAAALLAVAPLALQFSRQATESTPTGTLWAAGFLFLIRALRGRRWSDWVCAGVFFGLSLYFYAAGKLVLALLPMLGLYCMVRWRLDFFRRYALGFALMVAAFALTFLPYALLSARDGWQNFSGRAQETSILSAHNQADTFARHQVTYDPAWGQQSLVRNVLAHPVAWAQVLFGQLRFTAEVLYWHGDPTAFYQIRWHGGSMIAPFWAALTVLGLAYAAWNVWDARFGLACAWFWCGMLGPALTINTPSVQRLVCAWPAVTLFPAVVLDRVWAAAWPLSRGLARRWATVPLLALLVYFGIDSYQEYFVHYISLCPFCTATVQARHAQTLGQSYKAYQLGVGDGDIWFGYGSTRFVAKGVEGMEVAAPGDLVPITNNNGKGLDFIVYPYNAQYLPLLHLYYPEGVEEVVTSFDNVPHFVSYKVTAAQVASAQTLRVTYRGADRQTSVRNEPNLGTESGSTLGGRNWTGPPTLAYPADAVWEGGLVADLYGMYELTLRSDSDATLEVDGRAVLQAQRPASEPPPAVQLVLAKGVHDVRLHARLGDASAGVAVGWTRPKASAAPVDQRFLYNGPTGGLSGEVWSYQGTVLPDVLPDTPPRLRCSHPFFGFRSAEAVLGEQPFVARWAGTLMVPADGTYTLQTSSNGPSRLSLDGAVVLPGTTAAEASVAMQLRAGPHPVELRYLWQSGRAKLEWYWTRPDGTRELVPPTAFVPTARSWVRGEIADPEQLPR